ncbi:MAG TPA: 23S rRNA (adenine(2503)-C(2))-methyltransferase RlmN [Bacteroidales bacterium]|jgi:23S rRNA (adenine2503-C2)-methyltransferase|nr:23S rRNA (adenine(2503)-C(2))-methyltransferase RlmN [Bacteroidales bacterium]HQB36895.1 23S rRNA (adenine(2503)-C(2))-methyltransferase RlmN [Bacteroidales bacterium]
MEKEKLFGKTLDELIVLTKRIRLPGYAARQIADWLYKKEITEIGEMSNLSKKTRDLLSGSYETGLSPPVSEATSSDGTRKYLFKVLNNKYIETAYIPEDNRATICLSCQAGCKMGCIFCLTGKQGFQGNLSSNEILNQFRSIPEFRKLTNIVFMGMGEPLDNLNEVLKSLDILTSSWGYGWSPTRITVSTIGLKKNIREFLEKSRCHLAVSLHSPFDEERSQLMPIQKTNNIREIIDLIQAADINNQRRISFEYVLFKGINDSAGHVKELARLLNGIKCRMNIIRFHKIPGSVFISPSLQEAELFRDALNKKGILATVRKSRGEDIGAACGLLSTKEINKEKTA